MSNKLGQYLRKRRGDKSLREFSAMCNISHTHLDSIEKGVDPRTKKHVSISTDTLKLIAEGIKEDYLVLACLADNIDPLSVANIDVSNYRSYIQIEGEAESRLANFVPYIEFPKGNDSSAMIRSPNPIGMLVAQYDMPTDVLSDLLHVNREVAESIMDGNARPSEEAYATLADFFELSEGDLKTGRIPLCTTRLIQLKVIAATDRRFPEYGKFKNIDYYLDREAISEEEYFLIAAYKNASEDIRRATLAVLGLQPTTEPVNQKGESAGMA